MDTPIPMLSEDLYHRLPKAYDKRKFLDYLRQINQELELPEDLLPALVHVESKGDPYARSEAGARGWAQLMPETSKELGVDPYSMDSLRAAGEYLKGFMKPGRFKYDKLKHHLLRYNVGPEAAGEMLLGQRKYTQEARDYANKVIAVQNYLRSRGKNYGKPVVLPEVHSNFPDWY